MGKKVISLFISAVLLAAVAPTAAQSQTDYPVALPGNYLALPQTHQQAALPATSSAAVYSPTQYPTAGNNFLKIPTGYQQPTRSQPQYVAPVQPSPAAVVTSSTQPQIYATPQAPVISPQAAPVAPAQTTTPMSYDNLPTYDYDPALDPARYQHKTTITYPPSAKTVAEARYLGLGTTDGVEVGIQVSEYRYQEHAGDPGTDFVRSLGPKFGATFGYTHTFIGGPFVTGEFRGAYGENDYTGTGTASGIPDWLFEFRVLGGKDFIFENAFWNTATFDVTPYAGLGFRYLYNNFATVSGGYDRYSHYLYLPVGVTPRFHLTEHSRLSLNMEYDQLLYGWQVSELSENNSGEPNLTNRQSGGYGLRASAMWEWHPWSFGPFMNYWNIYKSSSNCALGTAFIVCGDEPSNQTLEAGIQGRYRF